MKIIKEPFMQLQPEHFISVTFETEVKDADSVRELIEKCAKNVLERENIPFDAEIDARVVDAEEIRRLNAEFRDKDVVTDVLSFPMFDYYNGAPREDLERRAAASCSATWCCATRAPASRPRNTDTPPRASAAF